MRALTKLKKKSLGKNHNNLATFSKIPRPPSQNKPRGRGAGDGGAREGDTGNFVISSR